MSRLHLSYRSFAPSVREATDALFASKPWRQDEEQHQKFTTWIESVSGNYGMKAPQLIVHPLAVTTYERDTNTIYMNTYSVTTLFVSTRLAMLLNGHCHPAVEGRDEGSDAMRWGISLFYKVRPRLFRKAVRAGGIEGVSAWDLVPSDAEQALCKHCEHTAWMAQDGTWRHLNTGWRGCPDEFQPEQDALVEEVARHTAAPREETSN